MDSPTVNIIYIARDVWQHHHHINYTGSKPHFFRSRLCPGTVFSRFVSENGRRRGGLGSANIPFSSKTP